MLDALPAGKRLIYRPLKAYCPRCQGPLLTPNHIFAECPLIQAIWTKIDALGSAHFPIYTPFTLDTVLDICQEYQPVRLYHMSAIWAIWRMWCTFMYDDDYEPQDNWEKTILNTFKEELIKRIYESVTAMEWLEIAKLNRQHDNSRQVPEKEFLLIWAQSVTTNPTNIQALGKWIGNKIIVTIDNSFHRPRLRIQHALIQSWLNLGGDLPPPHWNPSQPAFVAG